MYFSTAYSSPIGKITLACIVDSLVGLNGSLTGFSGGVQMKIKLLKLEGVDMSRLFVPTGGTAL